MKRTFQTRCFRPSDEFECSSSQKLSRNDQTKRVPPLPVPPMTSFWCDWDGFKIWRWLPSQPFCQRWINVSLMRQTSVSVRDGRWRLIRPPGGTRWAEGVFGLLFVWLYLHTHTHTLTPAHSSLSAASFEDTLTPSDPFKLKLL